MLVYKWDLCHIGKATSVEVWNCLQQSSGVEIVLYVLFIIYWIITWHMVNSENLRTVVTLWQVGGVCSSMPPAHSRIVQFPLEYYMWRILQENTVLIRSQSGKVYCLKRRITLNFVTDCENHWQKHCIGFYGEQTVTCSKVFAIFELPLKHLKFKERS